MYQSPHVVETLAEPHLANLTHVPMPRGQLVARAGGSGMGAAIGMGAAMAGIGLLGDSSGGHSGRHSSKKAEPSTIKIFMDDANIANGWVGCILDVIGNRTTYALQCTSGPDNDGYCNNFATSLTLTQGPGTFLVTSTSVSSGKIATITKSCAVTANATEAPCTATITAYDGIVPLVTMTAFNVTGVQKHQVQAKITGGLAKLHGGEKEVSGAWGRTGVGVAGFGVVVLVCVALFGGL